MPIHIQEINVNQLGPINQLHLQPGRFNLVYGHNERGKTHLVEFIIRTLFGNADWQLRPEIGQGRVTLCGINGHTPSTFTTNQPNNLLNYLEIGLEDGLPPHLDQLLVVKAGNLHLSNHGQPMDKSFLQAYLSGQNTLELIENRISPTIANAEIKDGLIFGAKRGEIKTQDQLKKKIDKTRNLMDEIDRHYSNANIQLLKQTLDKNKQDLAAQEQARRIENTRIKNQIEQFREALEAIPDHLLSELEHNLLARQIILRDIAEIKEKLHLAEKNSLHYSWVKHAALTWQEISLNQKGKSHQKTLLYVGLGFILAGILASFFIKPIYSAAISFTGILMAGLHFKQKPPVSQRPDDLDMIVKEYQKRFNAPLSDIAALLAKKEALETVFYTAENLKKSVEEKQHQLSLLEKEIEHQMVSLHKTSTDKAQWQSLLEELKFQANALRQKIKHLEQEQIRLGLPETPSGQPAVDSGTLYDPSVIKDLNAERTFLEKEIHDEELLLENLKQRICDLTGTSITTAWEILIEDLRCLNKSLIREYQEITARILAGMAVGMTIEELRGKEDEKIHSGLRSDLFLKPLYQLTGRYDRLYYDGTQLIIGDAYGDYPLSDISTGAQEQALLALRLGFAAKTLKTDQLFLILDDAFQHTDWSRRENMIQQLITLAQEGWQIFYFTMDDHLRDQFISHGEQAFGEDFKFIDLNTSTTHQF
jgi:energy-coupling factor transporter ATP-binding protein EcfA2